jgi:hypothetical protein
MFALAGDWEGGCMISVLRIDYLEQPHHHPSVIRSAAVAVVEQSQ